MIVLDAPQGSDEWLNSRLGIPTASRFSKLVTPKTCKPSAQRVTLLYELLAEWMTGEPADAGRSQFMERGNELEDEARRAYEFENDVEVRQVGLCLLDDRSAGASPDGLIGDDGGLEIKNPSAVQHVKYLLDPARLVADYHAQVQGCLWVTGRKWWDIYSYNPAIKHVLVRCGRDEPYIAALAEAVKLLNSDLHRILEEEGYIEPPSERARLDAQAAADARLTVDDLLNAEVEL